MYTTATLSPFFLCVKKAGKGRGGGHTNTHLQGKSSAAITANSRQTNLMLCVPTITLDAKWHNFQHYLN